ncbi:hypothetical protein JCM14469_17520 [Desulfatiferula olefinivorans]
MPFTFTVTSTSTFTMVAGTPERNRLMIQPARDGTVEPVSTCRARARKRERKRIVHAIALPVTGNGLDMGRVLWYDT